MKYTKGYKYQLYSDEQTQTGIIPAEPVFTKFIDLTATGLLIIRAGYAWDGCSGPTFDTENSMLGGLVHDALYQLLRLKLLPQSFRPHIDLLFKEVLIKEGMFKWRAHLWYLAVRKCAGFAADPKNRKKIYEV